MKSSSILDFGVGEHAVAYPSIQVPGRYKVHFSTENFVQLFLDVSDLPSGDMSVLEFIKNVNIAIRAEIIPENRSKESQLAYMATSTKVGKLFSVERNTGSHGAYSTAEHPCQFILK